MRPRIAIPIPHSSKSDYAQRSLPQYTRAVELAGGEPIVIPLEIEPDEIARRISDCDAVLLPGSAADIDPQKYGVTERHPRTADPDPRRDTADELLLQDAYNMRKPILGICYGMQTLNVYRTGTLVQDLVEQTQSRVNHEAGREVPRAHTVRIDPVSKLAIYTHTTVEELAVNSSHHQAVDRVGDGLRAVARSPDDKVIEALEGTAPDHWVMAVQWHPERSYDHDPASREIFHAFVEAAREFKAAALRG